MMLAEEGLLDDRARRLHASTTEREFTPPRLDAELLRAAMEAAGFTVYSSEWWRYDYGEWPRYPVLDVPFSALSRAR
jgi:D-alanyl-D-alanine dipeptidase